MEVVMEVAVVVKVDVAGGEGGVGGGGGGLVSGGVYSVCGWG